MGLLDFPAGCAPKLATPFTFVTMEDFTVNFLGGANFFSAKILPRRLFRERAGLYRVAVAARRDRTRGDRGRMQMSLHRAGSTRVAGRTGRGSGTFRIPLLFRGLRRFVYLVRRSAGRQAELTTGITLICRMTNYELLC